MITIANENDFKDIVICALRYSLGRRTYITQTTADFIKNYPSIIDNRVKQVMLNDLKEYFDGRGILWHDDDCDYNTWLDFKEWLEKYKDE